MVYRTAKIFHLLGLVAWLGPSTGGYVLLLLARSGGEAETARWLAGEYLALIHLEAAGLGLLLISGAVMRLSAPALARAGWLKLKLLKVFCVVVPLEAGQLLIYHLQVMPALESGSGVADALHRFDIFSVVALAILVPTVAGIFYLAVFRPEIKRLGGGGGERID